MTHGVPAAARAGVDRYLDALPGALAGGCEGIYLTGSIALGDWQAERSDLDLLTVLPHRLTPAELDALATLHARLAGDRPYADAIYLTLDQLGARPAAGDPGWPHAMNGDFYLDGYQLDPVLLATLAAHGVTVQGPPATELDVAPDPAWLREWNLGNLASYWRPWAASARTGLAADDPGTLLDAEGACHGLLGPARLHYTIATGGLLAKTAAADYTAQLVPGYEDLLARAKAWRLGDDTVAFFRADWLATCDVVDAVADAAFALDGLSWRDERGNG